MSDAPVNLNKHRKARARADAKTRATANTVIHGRSKGDRQANKDGTARLIRHLDNHALEKPAKNTTDDGK